MEKNFSKGYATVLGELPASNLEYYTAHHGVYKGPKLARRVTDRPLLLNPPRLHHLQKEPRQTRCPADG